MLTVQFLWLLWIGEESLQQKIWYAFMNWVLTEYLLVKWVCSYVKGSQIITCLRVLHWFVLKLLAVNVIWYSDIKVPLFTTSTHYILHSYSSHSSILIWQSITLMMSTGSMCVGALETVCACIGGCIWVFLHVCVSVREDVWRIAPVE